MKNLNKIFTATLLSFGILTGCKKDFLDKGIPQDQIVIENFYKTEADLRAATAFLYTRPWFDFNWSTSYFVGNLMSGDAMTQWDGSGQTYQNFTIAPTNDGLKYGWASLYNVVAQSNTTINNVEKRAPESLGNVKVNAIAEARFMRAIAYYYLVQLWGPVPIVENNAELATSPNVNRNIEPDVYRFIIEDLRFAANKLPKTDQPGRVTSWSAKGLLSKVFLTKSGILANGSGTRNQADLDSAKKYAADVIDNSGLMLMDDYYKLFQTAHRNNPESLFAIQYSSALGQDWGNNNFRIAWITGDGAIANFGEGWAGILATKDLVDAFDARPGDLRRKAVIMKKGDVYPDLVTEKNTNGYTMTADRAYVKKYVVGGPLVAGNEPNQRAMWAGINTYMLRLADVYLVYAEAAIGNNTSTSDPRALKAYLDVRRRGQPNATATSITWEDVFKERRLEFALEDIYWYDLKRLSDYNLNLAKQIISNQNRADYRGQEQQPVVNVTPAYFTLPIPSVDLVTNPKLGEAPVPYYK